MFPGLRNSLTFPMLGKEPFVENPIPLSFSLYDS
jgi:hypothetical protein